MPSARYPLRNEVMTWDEVEQLIDILVPQIRAVGLFDAMLMITRGGIVPGGMLAEILGIPTILVASVDFPVTQQSGLMAWPAFLQFPANNLLLTKRTLIIDDVWGSGRTSTAVRGRVEAAGATPFTCVLHYNPNRSLFSKTKPDFYGAITDAYVVYPWELDRGTKGLGLLTPEPEIN
ncbi:MAG: phosphoribosyltransferase [Armatimonadetes bacterium]|nr:phosphoribosyltransferase [Anaerolineae bacterium]